MKESYSSETFLGWQKEFRELTKIPFLYEKFTMSSPSQITFSTSFEGFASHIIPSCGEILGKCRLVAHVFSHNLSHDISDSLCGIDIIVKYLIPFFSKRYSLERSSVQISEALIGEEQFKDSRILHVCEFELKNIFVLGDKPS